MNKLYITALVAICFSTLSYAQDKGDVEFGANVGFNHSTVSTAAVESFQADTGTGFNLGLYADYFFSYNWSIKAKLIYDQKGWNNGTFSNNTGTYLTHYNLNYLTVPVMANWHFGSERNWYLNVGPYAGFLISATETTLETDVKEAFNTFDLGLSLGLGLKIPVTDKLKISVEYEVQAGLMDVFKDNDSDPVINSRGSLNLGVNFLMQ